MRAMNESCPGSAAALLHYSIIATRRPARDLSDWPMNDALLKIWWVGLGGFLGANARYWLGVWFEARAQGGQFPWATLVINVTGSFLLGLFMALDVERLALPRAPVLRLLFAVGFLGAYTTFSTFTYETLALAETGAPGRAFGNVLGSVAAGLLAAWLGMALGRRF